MYVCVQLHVCAGAALELQPFSRSPQALADYASENLEAMNPPLFLRFLNLLMNDAIFLLDEAIQVGLSCRCHVGNHSACLKTPAALLRGTQPGSKRPLWFVIIKSLGLLAGILSSQRVLSPGGSPWGLQGQCQGSSCPWCITAGSPQPVADRRGFYGELLPAVKAGDVDVAHPGLNVYGLSTVCLNKHSVFL